MPGLVGVASLNGDKVNPSLVAAMRNAIRHRDWYEGDDYVNSQETVAIFRVNLGIISKKKQPYLMRDGQGYLSMTPPSGDPRWARQDSVYISRVVGRCLSMAPRLCTVLAIIWCLCCTAYKGRGNIVSPANS